MIDGLRILVILGISVVLPGCQESCPAGHIERNHVCVAEATGGNSSGGSSSNVTAGTSAEAGSSQGNCTDSTFGNTCKTAADCGCDTAFCAAQPGQSGICSHTGCLENPAVCPANWSCGDFSAFQPGLSLCTP